MRLNSPKMLLTASGLAIALALGPVIAQQSDTAAAVTEPAANTNAPVAGSDQPVVGSAQGTAPLTAPTTPAKQPRGREHHHHLGRVGAGGRDARLSGRLALR